MAETKAACKDAAEQLALCIEQTPCVKSGRTIMDCLKTKEVGDCEVRDPCGVIAMIIPCIIMSSQLFCRCTVAHSAEIPNRLLPL